MDDTRRMFLASAAAGMIAAAALFVAPAAHAQAELLDGKVFSVKEGEAGKPANLDNVLTFAAGLFHSKACDEWGYGKGTVKASREGEAIRFEAETLSEKYGTRQVWKGTIRGDTIEGTKTLYKKPSFFRPDPAPEEGWFKGTLRP
ncbi:MAG: hypothetical protein KIT17_24295 [Rubrivivax sp.]|nr:hypothetical protein [Rubrivivax sp.]